MVWEEVTTKGSRHSSFTHANERQLTWSTNEVNAFMWWFGIKGVRSCVGSFVECLSANFQPYLLQNVVLGGEGGLPAWLHLLSQCDTLFNWPTAHHFSASLPKFKWTFSFGFSLIASWDNLATSFWKLCWKTNAVEPPFPTLPLPPPLSPSQLVHTTVTMCIFMCNWKWLKRTLLGTLQAIPYSGLC